jgi:hypothetical protein
LFEAGQVLTFVLSRCALLRQKESFLKKQAGVTMKTIEFLTTAILATMLPGCASFNTSTKSVNLQSRSVALDVKQRMVISQKRNNGVTGQVICAEPSPDALSVASASAALSLNRGDTLSGDAGGSFSESGAMIGLRTQSIQLLRDAMYRLCEGYASGAITEPEFAAMQRRYQSTMLGLIAIEQLTGPVVASQAMLLSNAKSGAGASGSNEEVATAEANVKKAEELVLGAQTESEKSSAALEEARKKREKAAEALRLALAKEKPDPAEVDSLRSSLETARSEEKKAELDSTDKQRRLESARKGKEAALADLMDAKSAASTATGGDGRFGLAAKATADSNEVLSTAVTDIVKEINDSYLRDGCMTLISDLMRGGASLNALVAVDKNTAGLSSENTVKAVQLVKDTMKTCVQILEDERNRIQREEMERMQREENGKMQG